MEFDTNVANHPRTEAVRRALAAAHNNGAAADLMFLEHWVAHPTGDLAATLRAGQIRRANPTLADAIRQELAAQPRQHARA